MPFNDVGDSRVGSAATSRAFGNAANSGLGWTQPLPATGSPISMSRRRSRLLVVALTCAVAATLAGCNDVENSPDAAVQPGPADSSQASPSAPEPAVPPVELMSNVKRGAT